MTPFRKRRASDASYGFRKGRSTADAIQHCFIALARKDRARWILEADIKGCFDNISHEWLLQNVPMNKAILRKWLKAGYLDKFVFNRTEEGTPQGGIISPVLANLVLNKLAHRTEKPFSSEKEENG
ncbi:MAG: reverse transcriptase domain-containing protein [Pyrinomonadaceae bacterium]